MAVAVAIEIDDVSRRAQDVAEELRAGRRLELIRGGHRIGEIVPCDLMSSGAEREAARQRLLALLDHGFDLGGWTFKNRDELYERD